MFPYFFLGEESSIAEQLDQRKVGRGVWGLLLIWEGQAIFPRGSLINFFWEKHSEGLMPWEKNWERSLGTAPHQSEN